LLSSGAGRTQVIRMVLIVSDTSAVELKIDPAVVLATRKYVDDKMADELAKRDNKPSVRVATTGAIALSATQTIDGVVLAVGDRVLVKDQADAKQNGVYLVAAQGWTRVTDADTGAELNAGARLYVEEGSVNGSKVWYLATTGAITLGTTLLQFKDEHPDATETVRGVTRYATQAQTNAGTADDVAVTPKKLRMGFAVLLASTGYIAFPTWMGGVIIQWGGIGPSEADVTTTFPIAFPNLCFHTYIVCDYTAGSGIVGYFASQPISRTQMVSRGSFSSLGGRYMAIGC